MSGVFTTLQTKGSPHPEVSGVGVVVMETNRFVLAKASAKVASPKSVLAK